MARLSGVLPYALTGSLVFAFGAGAQAVDPPGHPSPPLTEAEAVRLALARPAVQALADARVALAQSEVTAAGRWPNPEFEYAREEVDRGPGDSTDEFYWLSQRFELSGRRGLLEEAAERRIGAAILATEADRAQIEADARARFYQVLHQQERMGAVEEWTRRMSAIEAVIRRREAAGDVSGYDALRLARERALALAALQKEQARYARLWAELAAVLGGMEAVDPYTGVAGRLLPDAPPPLEALLDAARDRPDIVRLEREAAAHDLERRAGKRGWVPELTLGVGRKTVDDDLGRDSGPMVAAGITIPVFDHGQAEQQRAAANAAIARSEHALALAAAAGEIHGLWQEATELTRAAEAQRAGVRVEAARLIEIAEASYRGGELGVLELLDAYRGAYDAAVQALELAAAARQARIDLDRLAGGPAS